MSHRAAGNKRTDSCLSNSIRSVALWSVAGRVLAVGAFDPIISFLHHKMLEAEWCVIAQAG